MIAYPKDIRTVATAVRRIEVVVATFVMIHIKVVEGIVETAMTLVTVGKIVETVEAPGEIVLIDKVGATVGTEIIPKTLIQRFVNKTTPIKVAMTCMIDVIVEIEMAIIVATVDRRSISAVGEIAVVDKAVAIVENETTITFATVERNTSTVGEIGVIVAKVRGTVAKLGGIVENETTIIVATVDKKTSAVGVIVVIVAKMKGAVAKVGGTVENETTIIVATVDRRSTVGEQAVINKAVAIVEIETAIIVATVDKRSISAVGEIAVVDKGVAIVENETTIVVATVDRNMSAVGEIGATVAKVRETVENEVTPIVVGSKTLLTSEKRRQST